MSVKFLAHTAALCLAGLVLVGCGNAPGRDVTAGKMLKATLTRKPTPPTQDELAQQVAASAAAILTNTSDRAIIISIPKTGAMAALQQLGSNGAYETYGSPSRRTVVLRAGMLTATRGMGQDLMSVDVDAVQSLIAGRKAGTAQRRHRHLDGENLTITLEATCTVTPGGSGRYVGGEIDSKVTSVSENCVSQTTRFQNSYQVTPAGRIVQSVQWIGPMHGSITVQQLR